ncbi:MAG TPA: hypothetical protein VH988_17565 [Thermoanaerobaculia bacterium]|jgi:hypothetical protein|nr:hypothetical protein [Thermoanaerobaculia bacterium]
MEDSQKQGIESVSVSVSAQGMTMQVCLAKEEFEALRQKGDEGWCKSLRIQTSDDLTSVELHSNDGEEATICQTAQ